MKIDGTMSTTADANPTSLPSTGIALPDDVLEKLYQSYSIKQRRSGLACFLAASILFDVWAILVPQGQSWESLGVTCIFLILNVGLSVFLWLCGKSRFRGVIWEIAPFIAWLLAITQLFFQLFLKGTVTPRDSLGWAILLNFLVYVALPVLLKYTGLLLGIGSFAIYINTIIGLAKTENYFWSQQAANVLLLGTAALIGLLCYFLGEIKQRRAFVEAKQSLEVKMIIEEQSAEQEQLLLSVLPEHVAVKMRQDLGSTNAEQFKKIYMSRHENVSILYADIVGFTAISSTYSAQDLVKILNELFARFDRLAEKYQQLRIKILGDCYYCVSGAPVERPDHAVLCVHMGLSMVKAIKYVQQKTNSPVDMRVGIHTGAVLAGVLGQRQWQFDVYSKDVELANKMESSGMAGRVHLSEKTLGFLNGEFEVEPAFGEKREELLRIAGLKTYFIIKVLKPFVPSEHKNGNAKSDTKDVIEPDGPSEIFRDDDESKCTSPGGDEESNVGRDEKQTNEEDYKTRLRKELVSRDGHGQLSKDINMWLTFKDDNLESSYSSYREPYSSIPLCASLLVHLIGGIYSFLVLPRTILHFEIILMTMVIVVLLVFISIAENFPGVFPAFVIHSSRKFNDCTWLRRIAGILTIMLVGLSNAADMFSSSLQAPTNISITNINLTQISLHSNASISCLFPSYFSNFTVLILIAASIISQLSHIVKIFIMICITGIHCYVNIFHMEEPFRNEEYHTWNNGVPLRYSLSALLVACTLALAGLARHMDKVDRVIFMWKTEVIDQKEKASDMRRRNEKLVYNVLPMHVAEHFMGNRKRQHDELYSQSYAEVGVLFASMPNFSDFYTEESVNNQGLECLRFLNEVISDYDALLELPQFQDVIKIKTIGSTYMAASGLNPSRIVKAEEASTVRWAHLALLVEFALELKKALQGINEQSFNHFVLKMGINHGPITAGVIGARKPHYDIWGNTVNVASRMESTGKAGAIQVTEETCEILQPFGYTFEQRGLVAVKGKGELMTYYLQGKIPRANLPPSSPILACVSPMETVQEVDETREVASPITPPTSTFSSGQSNSVADNEQSNDSPIPHLTSISSASTTSPNSVRLNQDYVEMQATDTTTTTMAANIPTTVGDLEKSTNDVTKSSDESEVDVQTPLLRDNDDATSTTANSFSIDEKDSLLDNEN